MGILQQPLILGVSTRRPYPSPRNNCPSSFVFLKQRSTCWAGKGEVIMQLSPEEYARAIAYSNGAYWIYFTTTAYTFLVLWGVIRWRVAPQLRDWVERNPRPRWLQFLHYA